MGDGSDDPTTSAILEASRFWVQKVLVPITVTIGITGNAISVVVLTRKRMRNSTNIYLSALALADIIHLFFVFLLSFKHYSNIHDGKYALYWRFHGLSYWFCDAASSTSIWLTVSFTVERYIAVCHPIKGKYLCTERRAKCVIVIVYIFCILTTASTTFEHQLTANETCIKECKEQPKKSEANDGIYVEPVNICNSSKSPCLILIPRYPNMLDTTNENIIKTNISARMLSLGHVAEPKESEAPSFNGSLDNSTTCCVKKFLIDVEPTNLGQNETYINFISWYSAIVFTLLPLVLIATFNCFLIRAVYMSQRMRRTMTQNSQESISVNNEKKITVMLIGVVILFIVCHTPSAAFLIYNVISVDNTVRGRNIQRILGNIFNFCDIINAACNFLLYCFMSKKFRTTFKQIFSKPKIERTDTIMLSSIKSRNPQKFDPKRHGLMRRNASEYHTPRSLETQSLTSIPRSKSLIVRPLGKAKSSDLNV